MMCWNRPIIYLTMPSASVVLLWWVVILCFHAGKADGMQCYCSSCPPSSSSSSSSSSHRLQWKMCSTNGACFTKVYSLHSGGVKVQQGCLPTTSMKGFCNLTTSTSQVSCCRGHLCNRMPPPVGRRLLAQEVGTMSLSTADSYDTNRSVMIAVVVCVPVAVTAVIVALLISMLLCLYFRRGGCCRTNDLETARNTIIGNRCSAIVPPHVTLSSMLHQQRSAQSPSLSLLVQEAIVSSVVLEHSIRRGTFSERYVGRWRRENVNVRVYPELHEQLFYSESHLYQIPHMYHSNIKTFIAAQNRKQSSSVVLKYLITDHYERGTLADYLGGGATMDISDAVLLAQSAASGLAHLHQEVRGEGGRVEKEAIAHRNISSYSFWIKNDGTCCLGDLSLAVKDDGDFQSNLKRKPLGHTHYLSPELLNCNAKTREEITFKLLKKADVYAFGLVMWEIARRCLVHDVVENAELPFTHVTCGESCQGACPQIATLEQMRDAVLTRSLRPPLAEQWNLDDTMQSYVYTFSECWNDIADLRPTAMTVKNSLDKLLSSSTLTLPCHKDTGKSCQQQE